MIIVYIVIGLVILYGVFYLGYRKGESDTHLRRNSITPLPEQRLKKRAADALEVCVKCGCGRHNHPDHLCNANYQLR